MCHYGRLVDLLEEMFTGGRRLASVLVFELTETVVFEAVFELIFAAELEFVFEFAFAFGGVYSTRLRPASAPSKRS